MVHAIHALATKMKYTRLHPFSFHAFHRLGQRTQLTSTDVMSIIGERKFVDIGAKPGVHRRHLLFYSVPDQVHFVAIQDPIDGTLITILPLEYHEHLAWKVPGDQLELAQALAEKAPGSRHPAEEPPSSFSVTAQYSDEFSCPRYKLIAKLQAEDHGHDINELLNDQYTLRILIGSALAKGVDPNLVESITIRPRPRGNPVFYDLGEEDHLSCAWAAIAGETIATALDAPCLAQEPTLFYVGCRLRGPRTGARVKRLGKVPSGSYENNLRRLLADECFFAWVTETALVRSVIPELIDGIFLRLGRSGENVLVELDHLSPSGVAFVRAA